MNELIFGPAPGATTAAEESTAWPMVSRPTYLGGLGFGFKWNMGWMHDTLRYMAQDPIHRKYHHNDLTFGLLYAFHENFILPLSHDEVVHGKGSLIGKMPGDRWQRFANLRAYYGFMWTHPGKKLLFMGGEFAQEREWNHDAGLDWHLLGDPLHRGVQQLVRDLNRLYRELPALHELDCRARRVPMDRRRQRRAEHALLPAPRPRPARARGRRRQFHAGAAPRLSRRRAARRPLSRTLQHRRRSLWRQRRRQWRRRRGGSASRPWPVYSLVLTLPPLATLVFTHEAADVADANARRSLAGHARIRSARPGTAKASISRCSPRMRERSSSASSTRSGQHELARIALPEYTDQVWHGYLPDARPGLLYGYRVHGPYRPQDGHRFNPNKLLLDPYAKALHGRIRWSDVHFGYRVGSPREDLSFDRRDNARGMPKCRVVDTAFTWGDDRRPHTPWEETIILRDACARLHHAPSRQSTRRGAAPSPR